MAKILKLTVTKLDGTEKTYSVLPVTKVAFEREFKCGLGTMKETQREEQVYWLAWDATKRAGEVVKPFDDWINDLLDVTVQDEDAPLGEGTSPTTLPSSPSSPESLPSSS
jgi:hypothetical protein